MDAMRQIREHYNVPAKKGMRVLYKHENKEGEIVGAKGSYLKIRLDGDKNAGCYHPTWELDYLTVGQPST
jgi:hypothetical protein